MTVGFPVIMIVPIQVEQLTSELSSEKESHKSHVEKMEEAQQKEVRELKEAHAKMADTLSQQAMKPRHDKDVVSSQLKLSATMGLTFVVLMKMAARFAVVLKDV